jgi:hypothetical protein
MAGNLKIMYKIIHKYKEGLSDFKPGNFRKFLTLFIYKRRKKKREKIWLRKGSKLVEIKVFIRYAATWVRRVHNIISFLLYLQPILS